MGAVSDHLAPCESKEAIRVLSCAEEQSSQRFGTALDLVLGKEVGSLDVDPIGGHPHEDICSEPGAQLTHPSLETLARNGCEVVGEAGDLEGQVLLHLVGFGDGGAEEGLGVEVIGTVHQEEVVEEVGLDLLDVIRDSAHECGRVLRERGAISVPHGQQLGSDRGTVRSLPEEAVLGD